MPDPQQSKRPRKPKAPPETVVAEVVPVPEVKTAADLRDLSPSALEELLDYYQDLFFHPQSFPETKIAKWQVDFLRGHRPWLFESTASRKKREAVEPEPETSLPKSCRSLESLAAVLMQHFHGRIGFNIVPTYLSNWSKGTGYAVGCPLPPPPHGQNYPVKKWIDWIEKYILPQCPFMGGGGKKSPKDELEEIELRRARKAELREDGKLIDTLLAARMAGGAMRELHDLWRDRNENGIAEALETRCKDIGVQDHHMVLLKDWLKSELQKFTNSVEAEAGSRAMTYQKELKKEAKKQSGLLEAEA